MRRSLPALAVLILLVQPLYAAVPAPAAPSSVDPIFLVGCFDAQRYPPMFCPNYTRALADISSEAIHTSFGEDIEVLEIGDWFFLLDALTQPNVLGGVISVRQGLYNLSTLRQRELSESFEDGLGLVGIHAVAYWPFSLGLAERVFPLNATKTSSGRVHRNDVITSRHTHVKVDENEINDGLPDELDVADAEVVYSPVAKDEGEWMPGEGSITVLYECTTAVRDATVPSLVAYERGGGRSVTFAGLGHTDAPGRYEKDLFWYNHSLADPVVRVLLGNSVTYVLGPLAHSLEQRIETSEEYVNERIGELEAQIERGEAAIEDRERTAIMTTVVIVALSALAVLGIGYLGFRGTDTE